MRVVVQVGRGQVPNPIHRHIAGALKVLDRPEPDWASALDQWLEISLATKGTPWEAAVGCIGEDLLARDSEGAGRGLAALKSKFD